MHSNGRPTRPLSRSASLASLLKLATFATFATLSWLAFASASAQAQDQAAPTAPATADPAPTATDAAPAASSPAGRWRIRGGSEQGERETDVVIQLSTDNMVAGTVSIPRMGMTGTLEGDFDPGTSTLRITLRFPMGETEMAIPAELVVEGDLVRGIGTTPDGGAVTFTGQRLTEEMLAAEAAAREAEAAVESAAVEASVASRTPLSDAFESAEAEVLMFNEHLTVLSSPWMGGRLPGTRGMELAREYMEWQFVRAGLEPAIVVEGSDEKSYRQPFPLGSNDVITGQVLRASFEDADLDFELGTEFEFTGMGPEGFVEGPVTFVGYAIEDGPEGYSSFAEGEDLTGRIALMFRFEPMNEEGRSLWADQGWSSRASFQRKFQSITRRNPAAIILVNPPGADDPRARELIKRGTRTAECPVVMMTPDAADRLVRLIDAEERGLMDLRRLADSGGASFDMPSSGVVVLAGEVEEIPVTAENVVGLLPGRGSLKDEFIVIGAHLDHLGFGEFGSRRGAGNLHPGADDNASGSAGVMLLAESLKDAYDALPAETPLRTIVFIGFDAEESGLNGARHYVRNPLAPLAQHSLMMNFDMIGRIENRRLSVSGVGTGEGMKEWAQPYFAASGLEVVQEDGGGGGSDHAAFASAGVPVLFAIIADFHGDYHTPDDTAEKINREDAVRTVRLWHALALDAAQRPQKFVQPAGGSGDRMRGGQRLAVRLGMRSRPDESGSGLEVVEVTDGGSAALAGIKVGDRIVLWEKEPISTREALVAKLREKKTGDVVAVTFERDGEQQMVYVTLQAAP